jgi:hypothetical protein
VANRVVGGASQQSNQGLLPVRLNGEHINDRDGFARVLMVVTADASRFLESSLSAWSRTGKCTLRAQTARPRLVNGSLPSSMADRVTVGR